MTGAIPPYGRDFRRESIEPDFEQDLAQTRYVFKGNDQWWIRANRSSEKWTIFFQGHAVGAPLDTFTEAMAALLVMRDLGIVEDHRE